MEPEPPWTFVTAPIDQGIRNVGGRDGARKAPQRLLEALAAEDWTPDRLPVEEPEVQNTEASLEGDLDRISDAVASVLSRDRVPIVLGGDHGTTFATVRGAARALESVGVTYLDVHLDVRAYRPRHTSGSSFRRLVEQGIVPADRVRALGIQEPADPEASTGTKASFAELKAWADEQGLRYRALEEVRKDPSGFVEQALSAGHAWCFSLDVDAVDERWAPGVSAPGGDRLSREEAVQAAQAAHGRYRVLDLCEYSPPRDEGEKTLRTSIELLCAALTGQARR